MEVVCFHTEAQRIRQFTRLPRRLYHAPQRTQDAKTEQQLLCGTHVLSHYFETAGFLTLDARGRAVARCMVTLYHGEQTAYIGFFESEDVPQAAALLFAAAHEYCRAHGREQMVGPVDASFWLGYRLKTDCFSVPYTGEPYQKPYYAALFQSAGYQVTDRYVSNRFGIVPPTHHNLKNEARLARMLDSGCEIRSPSPASFHTALRQIYPLLSTLYRDFPSFHAITEAEFTALFSSLRQVLDYDMVLLAYEQEMLVGFFICVPDYGAAACGSMTPAKLWRLMRIRRAPSCYVLLYLGADRAHAGLGIALGERIKEKLQKNGARSIGALIHEGKVTEQYFPELAEGQNHYVLLQKKLYP